MYRYKAADGRRDSPLLIAHTLVVRQAGPAQEDEGSAVSTVVALSFLGLLACMFIQVFAVSIWYRRNDRLVQSRLAVSRPPSFIEPIPPDEEAEQKETNYHGNQ